MSSEEDVLCSVSHVKYKKDEGTLYMMSQRLAWIQENRDTVSVSHLYADIKSQKISPEGKPKIQLQIVLNDAATFTFQFVHPDGPPTQITARNQIKEHLLILLPKFKRKLNPELEQKNKLLVENPGLMQLYRDLVMTDILTSEEFWKNHAPKFIAEKPLGDAVQEIGVSSGFLTGIQPTTDGVNGIVYNLTTELMNSIFRTYPAVLKKHKECVPILMNESEFWAKFFQSHYFHRDRLPVSKDVFYSCSKSDDKEMRKEVDVLRQTHKDIIALVDDSERTEPNFSNIALADQNEPQSAGVTAHRNMIKRFNQHSIMLLKASQRSAAPTPIPGDPQVVEPEPPKKKRKKDNKEEVLPEPEMERIDPEVLEANALKLKQKIEIGDLMASTLPDFQKLELTKVGRYLNGPVPVYQTNPVTLEDLSRTIHGMREASTRWNTKPFLLDAKMAATLIGDLSPGGAIMKTNATDTASQVVPPDIENELRNTYVSLCELLRHFWSCFPVTTPLAQEKVKRCHETLKKFEQIKLQQVKDRLLREHLPYTLMSHLGAVIAAADMKYNRWLSTLSRPKR